MYIWYYEKFVVKLWYIINIGKFFLFMIMNYLYFKFGIFLIIGFEDNSKFCMFYIVFLDSNVVVFIIGKW